MTIWKQLRTVCLLLCAGVLAACGGGEETASAPPDAEGGVALLQAPLTDVRTGVTFTLSEYAGQAVFIEPMATW